MTFSRCRIALICGKLNAKGVFLKGTRVIIKGMNNHVTIGRLSKLSNCCITILGNGCNLMVGGGNISISNTSLYEEDDNCSIKIGDDFTMQGGHIAATEGEKIEIGNNCMFSSDIEIRNGDSHAILVKDTNKRINRAKPVIIGDHVWLTAHVKVLKGSKIASNVIVGNSSIVTGSLDNSYCIYGGYPIQLLKENVDWDRSRRKEYD